MTINPSKNDFNTTIKAADAATSTAAILHLLYGAHAGSIPVEIDGEPLDIPRIEDIPDGARALPYNEAGLFFITGLDSEADGPDAYLHCRLKPTLVLWHGERRELRLVWAFREPCQLDGPFENLPELFGMDVHEAIALHGDDGWRVIYPGEDRYTPSELFAKYGPDAEVQEPEDEPVEPASQPEPVIDSSKKFFDAEICTPFTPEAYSMPIKVMVGKNSKSMDWRPVEMPLLDLISNLCNHQVGQKDGMSIVFADMVPGQRLKNAVREVYAIGLDVDNGIPTKDIDEALKKLNRCAVRYTTHSHNKTQSEYKKDEVLRFDPDADEITTDLIRRYLLQKKNSYAPLVDTVEYVEEVHETTGIMARVKHAPWPKNRIIVFLKDPYVIANEGKTQVEATSKWAKYPRALSELLRIPYDPACSDPSRLFYPPRHAENRSFSASVFGGKLLEKKELKLGNAADLLADVVKSKGGKSTTEAGKALGKWAVKYSGGFQVVDVLQAYAPDDIRGPASSGVHLKCAFDDGHSNPGDSNDRACYAVNANEHGNEVFILSCRHGSCQQYTNLDMLGKLIADGVIPREVLEDENFNKLDLRTPEQVERTKRDEKAEDARGKLDGEIEKLDSNSTEATIETVIELLAKALLGEMDNERHLKRIKTLTGQNLGPLRIKLKKFKRLYETEEETGPSIERHESGAVIFRYESTGYSFTQAWEFCRDEMLRRNTQLGYPKFCHVEGVPAILDIAHKDGLRIQLLDKTDELWSKLNTILVFIRKTENGDQAPQSVPREVAAQLFNEIADMVPAAPKISDTPCFLPNGDLVIEPGYKWNPECGLNYYIRYKPGEVFNVPDNVTIEHVRESVRWYKEELLRDMAWADQNAEGIDDPDIGFANTMSMNLTPFAMPMIDAKAPMFLFTKSSPDEGATLVVETLGTIVEGAEPQVMDYGTDEEMRKLQLSAAMEGRKIFFYDDVTSANSKALHRKLTSDTISDRVLGKSQTRSVPNRVLWAGTGINVDIGQETAKRSVVIYLDSHVSEPGKRDFYHPKVSGIPFKKFVEQNRALAVTHLLTIIKYWVQEGMKPDKTATRPAYDEWAWVLGGILKAAEVKGFLGQQEAKAPNPELAMQKEFIKATIDEFGIGVATDFRKLFNHQVMHGSAFLNGVPDHKQEECFREFVKRLHKKTVDIVKDKEKLSLRLVRDYDPDTGEQTFVVGHAPEAKGAKNAG